MEGFQDLLGGMEDSGRLREGAEKKQRLVEADQGSRIGEGSGIETMQELHYARGIASAEAIPTGFNFGQQAMKSNG